MTQRQVPLETDETLTEEQAERALVQMRNYAFWLLARRDYSRTELVNKFKARYPEYPALYLALLDQLAADGYQSDARFCESFINSRRRQGFGPQVIAQQLRLKGIHPDISAEFLISDDETWLHEAYRVKCKKFGVAVARLPRDKAQQMRFMRYRGFDNKQSQWAIAHIAEDCDEL